MSSSKQTGRKPCDAKAHFRKSDVMANKTHRRKWASLLWCAARNTRSSHISIYPGIFPGDGTRRGTSRVKTWHVQFAGLGGASGVEFHRAIPVVAAAHDPTPIPLGYPQETRLQIILYPKLGILNGQLERCTPDTLAPAMGPRGRQSLHARKSPMPFLKSHNLMAMAPLPLARPRPAISGSAGRGCGGPTIEEDITNRNQRWAHELLHDPLQAWHTEHPQHYFVQYGAVMPPEDRPTPSFSSCLAFDSFDEYCTVLGYAAIQEEEYRQATTRQARHVEIVHGQHHNGRHTGVRPAHLQTFFAETTRRRWFTVRVDSAEEAEETAATKAAGVDPAWDAFLDQEKQLPDTLDVESDMQETPWMLTTGFAQHLDGADKSAVLAAASAPSKHFQPAAPLLEQHLRHLPERVVAYLLRAHEWASLSHPSCKITWSQACQVNSLQERVMAKTPFRPVRTPASVRRYALAWSRMLCYTLRKLSQSDPSPPVLTGTARQRAASTQMVTALERAAQATTAVPLDLDAEMLELSMDPRVRTLVEEPLLSSPFNSPMMSYAAARGLGNQGQWLPAGRYTSFLSGMIYSGQLWLVAASLSPSGSSLQDLVKRRLANRQEAPLAKLSLLRLEGFEISRDEVPAGYISWDAAGEQVRYKAKALTLTQWRQLNQGRLRRAQDILQQELLMGFDDQPRLHACDMRDVMSNTDPLFSLVRDARSEVDALRGWLLQRVKRDPTRGQLKRHAGRRPVCRFLAAPVGDLLVTFLAVMEPFARFLRSRFRREMVQQGHFLFSSGGAAPWNDQRLTDVLARESRAELGMSLDVSSWRQMAVAIGRRHVEGVTQLLEDPSGHCNYWDPAGTEMHHLQASHTTRTGNVSYANRVGLVKGLTDVKLHGFRQISLRWWAVSGINILPLRPLPTAPLPRPTTRDTPAPRALGNFFFSPSAIASGSYGTVTAGWANTSGAVAIKKFKDPQRGPWEAHVEMIRNVPNHENVLRLVHHEAHRDTMAPDAYCVYEPLLFATLYQVVADYKPDEAARQGLLRDYASGLAHLHKHGLMHRDVNPNNVGVKSFRLCGPTGISDCQNLWDQRYWRYRQHVERFCELLLLLVHLTAGLPGRGTEILAVTSRNTEVARHVVTQHGVVLILTWY
ncbi:MAG: hypothetical protein M1826_002390 [Phylliscum demangeonii]|nr:MAG: hypothetical protein M1826_002390 [Phylliscum demangeonii]